MKTLSTPDDNYRRHLAELVILAVTAVASTAVILLLAFL